MRRLLLGVGVLGTCLVLLGLVLLGPKMKPVRMGNVADFWAKTWAIQIEPHGESGLLSQGVLFLDDTAYYELQHLHGSWLYKVELAELEASLPRAVEQITQQSQSDDIRDWYRSAVQVWLDRPKGQQSIQHLFDDARQARNEAWAQEYLGTVVVRDLDRFLLERRVMQTKWYWANFVFEFAWLAGLVWFVIWPGLRGHRLWRATLHIMLVPFLLMLPAYLGYATYSFTSAGPTGGVLYPWVVVLLTRSMDLFTKFDEAVLVYLPQVLEPLSQGIGSPMALTGRGFLGPTSALLVGAGLAGGCSVFIVLIRLSSFKSREEGGAEPSK